VRFRVVFNSVVVLLFALIAGLVQLQLFSTRSLRFACSLAAALRCQSRGSGLDPGIL